MCDNIAIMYKGRFVEIGTREDIYNDPRHIYTKRLLSAIPQIDVENRESHKENRRRVEQEYIQNQKNTMMRLVESTICVRSQLHTKWR